MPPGSITSARVVALAALVVCAILFFVVLATSGGGGEDKGRQEAKGSQTRSSQSSRPGRRAQRPQGTTYTVKTGDTLGSISEKTGVNVEQLVGLNPRLDPQALVTGQKLKLRE